MNHETIIKQISVIVPVYCEEEVLPEFYRRMAAILDKMSPGYQSELLFINDRSTDLSMALLLVFQKKNPRVKILDLSRNFGHQKAVTTGMDYAQGDVIAIIDADLQDPPEVIVEMVKKLKEGPHQVVYRVREKREGESYFKLLTARFFHRILEKISDTWFPLDSEDFRVIDHCVLSVMQNLREKSRYIKGLVSWAGFSQISFPYRRELHYKGKTKFFVWKMLGFALDGMTSFSDKPLRLTRQMGFSAILGGGFYGFYLIYAKLFKPDYLIQRWASVMLLILFFGGIQLLSVGILGEYLGRIYCEIKQSASLYCSIKIRV